MAAVSARQPVFFYDLGDPWCYLAAEQALSALPEVPEWEPVWAPSLGQSQVTSDRQAVERRARELGLQPIRWPVPWPPQTRTAMLAATYAKRVGRGVAFSLAAFRQAFAGGRDLGDGDTVLIAGAACEMHPTALLKGIALRSVSEALEAACARARSAGVVSLPAIELGAHLFQGAEAVPQAAATAGRDG
jgi:2-hydroxychromene-2-carboxylate isomerase